MSERTKGRLTYSTGAIYIHTPRDEDGFPIVRLALMDRETPFTAPVERDENAKHLVECWNACEGVDLSVVKAAALMLDALCGLEEIMDEDGYIQDRVEFERAKAAIKLARGETKV